MRGTLTRIGLVLALVFFAESASALSISRRYRSPRNPERKVRASTELIVLHTTEAPARSSLNKLCDRGEAHFCVTEDGGIYHIVDRDREAFHAGRSMWCGREDVDKFSIGIECVGYHNKPMPMVQLAAIRDLVKELKRMYRIPDERVVAHSHVAYGSPNKWQKRRHRGRKRCGMLFAMPSVRRVLDLKFRPGVDVDTRSGRLSVGDPYLQQVLYGRTDTMSASYRTAVPAVPAATAATAAKVPPKAVVASKPSTKVSGKTPTSVAQLKAMGYVEKGTISKTCTASKIAGGKWNAADTYYTIRNKVISGNTLDAAHLEKGMRVWMKK